MKHLFFFYNTRKGPSSHPITPTHPHKEKQISSSEEEKTDASRAQHVFPTGKKCSRRSVGTPTQTKIYIPSLPTMLRLSTDNRPPPPQSIPSLPTMLCLFTGNTPPPPSPLLPGTSLRCLSSLRANCERRTGYRHSGESPHSRVLMGSALARCAGGTELSNTARDYMSAPSVS